MISAIDQCPNAIMQTFYYCLSLNLERQLEQILYQLILNRIARKIKLRKWNDADNINFNTNFLGSILIWINILF